MHRMRVGRMRGCLEALRHGLWPLQSIIKIIIYGLEACNILKSLLP